MKSKQRHRLGVCFETMICCVDFTCRQKKVPTKNTVREEKGKIKFNERRAENQIETAESMTQINESKRNLKSSGKTLSGMIGNGRHRLHSDNVFFFFSALNCNYVLAQELLIFLPIISWSLVEFSMCVC